MSYGSALSANDFSFTSETVNQPCSRTLVKQHQGQNCENRLIRLNFFDHVDAGNDPKNVSRTAEVGIAKPYEINTFKKL